MFQCQAILVGRSCACSFEMEIVDFAGPRLVLHRLPLCRILPISPRNAMSILDLALIMPLDTIYLTRHGVSCLRLEDLFNGFNI